MAKYEKTLDCGFDEALEIITDGILSGSISADMEDASDFICRNSRCSVRVFERYSYLGGNRVSLSVTLCEGEDGTVHMSAITSGGSQAVFMKLNTFGEEAFLDKLREII